MEKLPSETDFRRTEDTEFLFSIFKLKYSWYTFCQFQLWFDMWIYIYIYIKMVMISLVSTQCHTVIISFSEMRTFEIISLSNFHIYNTVLLPMVTMLYVTSPGLTYFIAGSLYLLNTFTHFAHSPSCPSGNHQSVSVSMNSVFFCFVREIF